MMVQQSTPPGVVLASRLLWASLAFVVLRTAADWTSMRDVGPIGFSLTIVVMTLGLQVLLFAMIAKGHNWARVVFLVLFVAGTVLGGHITVEELLTRPLLGLGGLIPIALQGAALVLLFRPPASSWFRPSKAT